MTYKNNTKLDFCQWFLEKQRRLFALFEILKKFLSQSASVLSQFFSHLSVFQSLFCSGSCRTVLSHIFIINNLVILFCHNIIKPSTIDF